MPRSVQDSACALRADCETAASSPTGGGPAASPQEEEEDVATAYPAPLRLPSRRRPARRAGAAVVVDRTSPPMNARVESLSRPSSSDDNDVVDAAGSPRTPRRLRHVQRTITQLNAAAAAAAAVDGGDLRRRNLWGQPDRQTDMPQPLRIPRSAGGAGRSATPSPLQNEVSPEWLALRDEVDDVTRMVNELLEVDEDGERKYRLT